MAYSNQLQVEKQRVRPVPDELDTYRGVAAPSRKAVTDDMDAPIEMPKVGFLSFKIAHMLIMADTDR